ncbi:uncharacterized abhydrolase domain-containing protein DDB_G0269086-like [Manihot esculenta]|uniref:uncharacterized abhydrolase domain-containing protein DDB_G0269086-like n=1 Tax=Manihot esculenta TaxID=3983 RepID=UPI001CC75006|nr:uncharacterized abhydrolase domain-containing protein DDB_G0269086-like [Manihot esculenta]
MDQIKPSKNLILSRESMNTALDTLRAGRSGKKATQEVAKTISTRTPPRASRSPRTSTEGAKKAPKDTAGLSVGVELERADSTLLPGEAPEGTIETPVTEETAPGEEAGVIFVDEDVIEAAGEDALVVRNILVKASETRTAEDALPQKESSGVPKEIFGRTASKRPLHSDAHALVPKKFRAPRRPDPALPPLEKKKTSVVPLLFASNNDILNAEDITHKSPASVVAEIIGERMFGGITTASDPRLLALSGLLASSTQEQAAFRARSREDLGNTARELLLMVTGIFMEMDARDRVLRESMDRRIEEARLEENLSATSDARGNLAAIREDYKSLQVDLCMALEARKKAEGETAEAQKHAQSLEAELSHARRVLKESDERAAAAERDEAVSQKEEVQRQNEQLKADFDVALAQRNEALARVVVLEQELSKQTDNVKGLTLAAEESQLQNQQLCQQFESMEKKCSALLEEAKLAEDRVQLECEERLREYKESPELKDEIKQACEVRL